MRRPRLVLSLFLALFISKPLLAGPATETRRVLFFNELGLWSPGVNAIDQPIFAALRTSPYHIEIYEENLDTSLFPDASSQQRFRDWYLQKYRDRKPDLIIVVGPTPLTFMAETHQVFAPDTPVIFWASTTNLAEPPELDTWFTGVWDVAQPEITLETAVRLLPDTKHVFVTGGIAPYDRYLEALVRDRFRKYESRFEFTYLTDLDMASLLDRIKHLPDHSIVYHTSIMMDKAGTRFIDAVQSAPMVALSANAPVFAVDDVDVGMGTLGGYVFSFDLAGQVMADMAVRVLNGEKPLDIPIVRGANIYLFDWRALKRWQLREGDLPPQSRVINRQITFWEANRRYIVFGTFLILVQAAIIVALLWQRAKRKETELELTVSNERLRSAVMASEQVEAAMRESEERFRLVANNAPVMIWMANPEKLCTYFNDSWLAFTGRSAESEMGNGWSEGVHGDDLDQCLSTYCQSFDSRMPFEMEYRLRRHDGEYRWIFDLGVPRYGADGSFAGYIGSCIDVTERKQAEDALSTVSRRLIEAHEEERTRIARELHDDINQRLAILAVLLDALRNEIPPSALDTKQRLLEIQEKVDTISSDIQELSHRLHSSKLEYLGLAIAADGFCKEFSEHRGVQVDFECDALPKNVPSDVALCLFRVLQEALQNAAKHSGSRYFEVSIRYESEKIVLSVSDSGIGFNPDDAFKSCGLGIASMRERMKLVHGLLTIESIPRFGTSVQARVYVPSLAPTPD